MSSRRLAGSSRSLRSRSAGLSELPDRFPRSRPHGAKPWPPSPFPWPPGPSQASNSASSSGGAGSSLRKTQQSAITRLSSAAPPRRVSSLSLSVLLSFSLLCVRGSSPFRMLLGICWPHWWPHGCGLAEPTGLGGRARVAREARLRAAWRADLGFWLR